MTNELLVEARRGAGPVGTGAHVLRRTRGPSGATVAEVWLTVLFVPVVPLGEWTLEPRDASPSSWVATRVVRPHPLKSVAWAAGGVLAIAASLLPAYAAIAFFTGSKPLELGGLFSSAGAVVSALAWLDETRERVPFRVAVRALGRRAGAPGPEA